MVTQYLDVHISHRQLVSRLGTKSFGTPFRHLARLDQYDLDVKIGNIYVDTFAQYLEDKLPIIASVNTSDLKSYWFYATDHVVVATGIDEHFIYVNDPVLNRAHQPVPRHEFELAQLRFDGLGAVLRRKR